MSISFGTPFSVDDINGFGNSVNFGVSFDLGDGRVVYVWDDLTVLDARFSVTALDGTQLVAPRDVDSSTIPAPGGGFGPAQDIYAVAPDADGGFTVHYQVDADQLPTVSPTPPFNISYTADHYVRSFTADGTPKGPSQMVSGDVPYLTNYNSVHEVLNNGNVAVAHDFGTTILDGQTGAVIGGAPFNGAGRISTNSFDLVEAADGTILQLDSLEEFDFVALGEAAVLTGFLYTPAGEEITRFEIARFTVPALLTDVRLTASADFLEDGRIVVAWGQAEAPGEPPADNAAFDGGVMAMIISGDFANNDFEYSEPFLVNDGTENRQYAPKVTALADGGFIVGYESDESGGVSGFARFRIYDSEGTPQGGSQSGSGVLSQFHSVIGRDGQGLVIDELGDAVTFSFVAPITGTDGPDELYGTDEDDEILGRDGNDLISGRGGNDSVAGEGGNDTLFGAAGDDTLDGGTGDDLLGGSPGDDLLIGGDGADEAYGAGGNDTLIGGTGNDTLGGFTGDDSIEGGAGADGLWGALGDDTIRGGSGDDTLGGAGGNDELYGGAGDDEVWTAAGNDRAEGGAGDDTLGGFTGDDSLYGFAGEDELWGADGNDLLQGGSENDLLGGGNGNDTLEGGSGNDQVYGGAGNDSVVGGSGDDTVGGFTGDDTLWGAGGNDELFGGAGADTFRFSEGNDTVYGYTLADDSLALAEALWGFGRTPAQVVADFADDSSGTVIFDFGGGNTLTLAGIADKDLITDELSFF